MKQRIGISMAALAAVTALAGCSSDDGGGNNAVVLTSKADIIREIGNITAVVGGGDGGAVTAKAAGSGQAGARSYLTPRVRGTSGVQKAAKATECETGSSSEEFFQEVERRLPLFNVTTVLDYTVEVNSNCTSSVETYVETRNGREEYGDNEIYAGGEVPTYYYDSFSDGFSYKETDVGYSYVAKLSGRWEDKYSEAGYESFSALSVDVTNTIEGETFGVSVVAGRIGSPLIYAESGESSFTIHGPLSYSSTDCDGGSMFLDTPIPLTSATDEGGTYLNGGRINITSGSANVRLTFNADGSATYELSNGLDGTLTREELDAISDDCGLVQES